MEPNPNLPETKVSVTMPPVQKPAEPDYAELVRRELTRQFYETLKTHSDGRVVTIDFTGIPPLYQVMIPTGPSYVEQKEPPTINALDWFEKVLPGMWGYAEKAGIGKTEMCTRCGKCFPVQKP